MMGRRPQSYIPSFVEIGPLVPEKILKGFYNIWTWWPSWSCGQNHVGMYPKAYIQNLVENGPVVSEKSTF